MTTTTTNLHPTTSATKGDHHVDVSVDHLLTSTL